MPFLLPASLALLCDGLVVLSLRHRPAARNDQDEDHYVYHVGYLLPLAIVRLLLLVLPLLFHSYTGTAVRHVKCYQVFYGGSALVILVHMVCLALMDPTSLEGIVLVWGGDAAAASLWWWGLGLSFTAVACHLLLLQHVRSTAPMMAWGPKRPTLYFAVRTASRHETASGGYYEEQPALMHAMNEFVIDMQSRFQRAKSEWTHRLRDLGRDIPHHQGAAAAPRATAFRALLELFAHEGGALVQLDRAFEVDQGESFIFFVPQLLSFLLHGALYSSPVLEEWILDKCQRNVYFAHRCYWFLRSWCLEVPPETLGSRQASLGDLPNAGGGGSLVPFLDEPAVLDQKSPLSCRPREEEDKFLPQERAMIERLMMRIRSVGSEPARVLEMGPTAPEDEDGDDTSALPTASPAAMVEAAELDQIPVDPVSGFPSVRHFDALKMAETNGYGFGPSFPESDFFDKTPRFLDALIFMAENLFLTPREDRRDALRRQLRSMECEFLPSNSIYLPIGSHHHRVWRIVAEESIPISTKERVPCIVSLEVIDHDDESNGRPGAHANNNFWRDTLLRRRLSSFGEGGAEDPSFRFDNIHEDLDALHEWRFGERNPLRRVSLLDKVTTTVKLPLEKMKSQMREHLKQRDRSDEELQALAEQFLHEQAEHGSVSRPFRSLSPTNSTGSLVSLGQWSNPSAVAARASSYSERRLRDGLPYGSDDDLPTKVGESTKEAKSLRPPPVVFRESWKSKEDRVRARSAFGNLPGWRLLPILIKANDDLRQEQLASQLIQRMAMILARERVPVWLCPYEILALTDRGGIIEAIPDTISLDSLKKNSSGYTSLREFFHLHFGEGTEELAGAKANFVESLAAYSMVCFLLQIKDRHNGNILLDKHGHLVHIDFGFFLLSSPGKNAGFESAPFKLTREFVEVLDGPDSHLFRTFRVLCFKSFLALRRRCMEIILVVEMLKDGNEDLQCFRGRPDVAILQLKERFRLDLNDRACKEYVNSLVDDSVENWRTNWYDRYQRYFVGVL